MASTRVKTYNTITKTVTAIQFVRNAIGDVYEFNENRDMSVSFKNDKFSGTIVTDKGVVVSLTGKDYIIKDTDGAITTMDPETFAVTYEEVTE